MILVTGGAGYIGSHCVLALMDAGYDVIVFDNLSLGHIEIIEELKKYGDFKFIKGDLLNPDDIKKVFSENIEAVIHFAALSRVEESTKEPLKYYYNNVCGTLNLLKEMIDNNVKKLIFSSTAAIYGEPKYTPIDELHPVNPINPYGNTKYMIERILDDFDKAYDLKSVRLRYFNASGADSKLRTGEWHDIETHLIPNVLKSAIDKDKIFKIFGTDYNTKDGTCVRDYINIEDLISAHILALKYLLEGSETNYFNLGTNKGNSVKEVFNLCEKTLGIKIGTQNEKRRQGDPKILIADNKKAKEILGWENKKTLKDSIKSAYDWEKKLNNEIRKY